MEDNRYITLIHKSLSGGITPDEQADLYQWMSIAENGKIYDRISEEWAASASYVPEVEVDTKADFAKLQQRMRAAKQKETDPLRKGNEGRVVQMQPRKRSWLSIAAGLAILVAGGLWMMQNLQPDVPMLTASTDANETKTITLPDNSTVTLNENSTLTYPEHFEDDLRQVTLSGEAFFDIQRNEAAMFVARTRLADVEVLGTSFNIDNYPDETRYEVTVKTGKVQLRPRNSSKFITIEKGQVGVYDIKTKQIYKNWENPNTHRWRTGEFSFDDQYLRDVLLEIEAEFDIVTILERTDLEGCKLTARFEGATADKVMEYVAKTFEMKLKVDNEIEYSLLGGESCNKNVHYRGQ